MNEDLEQRLMRNMTKENYKAMRFVILELCLEVVTEHVIV